MLTGILLVILLISSFVGTNVLSLQLNSTEFEQAKTNMLLIDDVIQDVALRSGASSYVQFNMQSGGIGVSQSRTQTFSISVNDTLIAESQLELSTCDLIYRAGSQTPAADMILRGNETIQQSAAIKTTQPQGFIEVYHDEGAKIILEYDRVKVTSVGLIDSQTNLIEIKILTLEKGVTSGSGTVNVRLQNEAMQTTYCQCTPGSAFTVTFDYAGKQTNQEYTTSAPNTVFLITTINIRVDIT